MPLPTCAERLEGGLIGLLVDDVLSGAIATMIVTLHRNACETLLPQWLRLPIVTTVVASLPLLNPQFLLDSGDENLARDLLAWYHVLRKRGERELAAGL